MVVTYAFNPSTQETEVGRSLSSRTTWCTNEIQDSQATHRKPVSDYYPLPQIKRKGVGGGEKGNKKGKGKEEGVSWRSDSAVIGIENES